VHLTSQFGRAALVAVTLVLGGASGRAAAQTDDTELAALRAQFDQIRVLVERFDQRLKALEAKQSAATRVVPGAPPNATTAAAIAGDAALGQPTLVAAAPLAPPATTRVDAPAPTAAAAAVPDRHAWRQVTTGATQADVARSLGQPTTAFQLAGKTVWYYYYPAKGAGSVFFDSAGRASSVQSPSTGW
jgi:SmpA / OmlA family